MMHQVPQPPRPPIQYFEDRLVVASNGTDVERLRRYVDYFGDDFDMYICNSMMATEDSDPYEDPEVLETMLANQQAIDNELEGLINEFNEVGNGTVVRYSLEDIGDDGTVVLADGNPFDPDDDGADQPDPNEDDIIWSPSLPERAIRPEWKDDEPQYS